jgi:hypothetical protein
MDHPPREQLVHQAVAFGRNVRVNPEQRKLRVQPIQRKKKKAFTSALILERSPFGKMVELP